MNERNTGIFYDGYHVFKRLNRHHRGNIDHFNYRKLNDDIVTFLSHQLDVKFHVRFKGWYQGIGRSYIETNQIKECEDLPKLREIAQRYHRDHTNHFKLIEAGVETVYLPYGKDENGDAREKGIDVALSIAVGNVSQTLQLNTIILLTNDSDYVPLIHNMKKKGVDTIVISFESKESQSKRLNEIVLASSTFDDVFGRKLQE